MNYNQEFIKLHVKVINQSAPKVNIECKYDQTDNKNRKNGIENLRKPYKLVMNWYRRR